MRVAELTNWGDFVGWVDGPKPGRIVQRLQWDQLAPHVRVLLSIRCAQVDHLVVVESVDSGLPSVYSYED